MQIIASDKLGLLKCVNYRHENNSINEQKNVDGTTADFSRSINYVTFSGGFGGYEDSEITVCRENGIVECFDIEFSNYDNFCISDNCNLSFLTGGKCIYAKMLNAHHNIVYKKVRNADFTENRMEKSTKKLLYPIYKKFYSEENNIYKNYLEHDRLLITANELGNVYILNWEYENEKDKYFLEKTLEKKYENKPDQLINIYFEKYKEDVLDKINYSYVKEFRKNNIKKEKETEKEKEKEKKRSFSFNEQPNVLKQYCYNNMLSLNNIKHAYVLQDAINAVTINQILTNRFAAGSSGIGLKVLDLFTGQYMWVSKKLGTSLLRIKTELLVKSLAFLNDINVNILAATTYDHKVVLYDMRCQSDPVYVHDYHKIQNVAKDKNNCFNYDYSETDLVFTSIAKQDYVYKFNMPNDCDIFMEPSKKLRKKTTKNNSEETNESDRAKSILHDTNNTNEFDYDQSLSNKTYMKKFPTLFTCFTEDSLRKKNLKALESLQKDKQKANNKKRQYEKIKEKMENKEMLKMKKRSKIKEDMNNNNNNNKKKKKIIQSKRIPPSRSSVKHYVVKKFGYTNFQFLYISDNYGNIYKLLIFTGDELLRFLHRKYCSYAKVTYTEKKIEELRADRKSLYDFYKNIQEQNKSHWRNDLPVMWAKDPFDQFCLIFLKKIKAHNGGISSLVLHSSGNYLCSTSFERNICIVDTEKNKVLQKISIGNILTGCLFLLKNEKKEKRHIKKKKKKKLEEEQDNDSYECNNTGSCSSSSDLYDAVIPHNDSFKIPSSSSISTLNSLNTEISSESNLSCESFSAINVTKVD